MIQSIHKGFSRLGKEFGVFGERNPGREFVDAAGRKRLLWARAAVYMRGTNAKDAVSDPSVWGLYGLLVIVLVVLALIYRREGIVMATVAEFEAVLAAIDSETTRIANKIQELIDQIAGGGLTPGEESAALAALTAAADRLRTIGADPANPVPPEPTP